MDIKNLNNSAITNRSNDSVKAPSKDVSEKTSEQTSSNNLDKVTLTQAVSQVSSLEQKAHSVDIDNAARITELKSAIESGSYKVDAERVADKLIQTEALFSRF
ncbi:MAG: negative regulator of flagellin synthesis FlgM [Thiomicrorhabdus sp.]|nr:MAG: negative regulator of flagellin synthesis FlgM [Thiomicrorhabdus sp.]